ncbi:hypothetical protein [Yoonia sp.]|uniref:hypothetical protein n=1 Tax=Yoonia sp. TaxID=2212373 RepID=UPI002DFC8BA4|nr:hypothetical protein [Yoonia sp.]
MDFGDFEIEEAKAGHWVHLEVAGKPLFWDGKAVTVDETDKPCRVELRPADSNEVYEAFRKYQIAESAQNRRVERAKDKEIDALEARHAEKLEGLLDDLIVVAISKWENVYVAGDDKCTPDNIRKMIDRKASSAKRQVRMQLFSAIAEKRANLDDAAQV